MKVRNIDWSEIHEDIDFTCPYCDGSGFRGWDSLDEDEKNKVKEAFSISKRPRIRQK